MNFRIKPSLSRLKQMRLHIRIRILRIQYMYIYVYIEIYVYFLFMGQIVYSICVLCTLYSVQCPFFLPQDLFLEAPFLPWPKLLNFSDLTGIGVSSLVLP